MPFDKIEKELFFSMEEYDGRLAALRNEMAKRGVDALMLAGPENIYYVSGYQTFGFHNYQLLVVPLEGEPFLILRYLETMLAYRYAWVTDIVAWDDTEDPVAVTLRELESRGLAAGTVGVEQKSYFFQVATYLKLTAALPRLVDGSGLVEPCRAKKSAEEIAYMREAARLSDIGTEAAIAQIVEGHTDNDIAAAAFDAMTCAGSEYLTRDPIVTTGERSGIPHTCYMRRTLRQGDAVLIELSGVYNRYYAPLMSGAVVGDASPEVDRMAKVCLEALQAAIAAVKPGATSAEVDRAARDIIVREGLWENYRKRAGYSVGIGFSSWVEGAIASLKEDDPTVLEPGMTFHIPIALRLYGKAGLGFSHTVLVTETGVEALTSAPRELARC
ncbi:M24 family metallopeptidase [Afifella pfennigii]|uniref:M24 family metallopeptidase n=1 Tax=Afifella pfennigii TaxID=209897 RepID=UPI0005538B80|nr:Xaa-Pro peptidase family protein [Afifella pfennigii]